MSWTILHTESSEGWGGQEMRIVSEATGVAAAGHRVLLAARPGAAILDRARKAGLEVFEIAMPGNLHPPAIWQLKRLMQRERVDIVNTHSSRDAWLAGIAARWAGVTLIRTRHISKRIRSHALNFVHRLPQRTITTGEALRRAFLEDTGCPPEAVVSVPTGVDIEWYAPGTGDDGRLRRELGLGSGTRIVANVGVLRRAKRQELLIDVADRLRHRQDLHWVIAGEGGQRPALERKIADLGLNDRVRLLGHIEDIRWVLAGADVVVSTSNGMEGVPQALVQALAMARPVVATDDGAVGEIVMDGQTGRLVPVEDAVSIAKAVEVLLDDRPLGEALGRSGRDHITGSYSRAAMITKILDVYQNCISP